MASGNHPSRQWGNNRSALSAGPSDCRGFRYNWDMSDESPGWTPGNVNETTQRRDGGTWFFFFRALGEAGFPSLHFPKLTPSELYRGLWYKTLFRPLRYRLSYPHPTGERLQWRAAIFSPSSSSCFRHQSASFSRGILGKTNCSSSQKHIVVGTEASTYGGE